MFHIVFCELLQSNGISALKLSQDTNIPKSIVYDWTKGVRDPSVAHIQVVADYFKVSVDYLLGRTSEVTAPGGGSTQGDKKSSPSDLSEDELKLIDMWRKLDDDGRTMVMARLIEESRRAKEDAIIPPERREAI